MAVYPVDIYVHYATDKSRFTVFYMKQDDFTRKTYTSHDDFSRMSEYLRDRKIRHDEQGVIFALNDEKDQILFKLAWM